jgi:hypothetical protein
MIRYKWLFADWNTPINIISSMMLASQFTESSNEGFILSRANSLEIEGQFIQKSEYIFTQTSPLGEQIETQRIEYYVVSFSITHRVNIGLELIDPPRTVRPFISRLHKMMGLGMTVKDSFVNPLSWSEHIEKAAERFWITEIQAGNIGISDDSVVKITANGSSDVREDFFDFIDGRQHEIQCVKVNVISEEDRDNACSIELRRNGVAKLYSETPHILYPLIRDGLNSEIKKNKTAPNIKSS